MQIYKITNTVNGKVYIGQTVKTNLSTRLSEHVSQAKAGKPWLLQRAIRKYGREAFVIESLYVAATIEDLCTMETFFIRQCNSSDPASGYNMNEGGESSHRYWLGKKRDPETIRKLNLGQGDRKGPRNPFFGKKHSEETLRYLSEIQMGNRFRLGEKKLIKGENHG